MADEAAIRARWQKNLAARRAQVRALEASLAKARSSVARAVRVLKRHPAPVARKQRWHPDAKQVSYVSAGNFTGGGRKIVWHTTEGSSLPVYQGSAPHFTLNPKTGQLWQHIPLDQAARTLIHPAGTLETNRANAWQVELIGFAKDTDDWGAGEYQRIAKLARWIESNAGVPRTCTVKFTATGARPAARLSAAAFVAYAGHIGHEHVPGNFHWDPGQLRIKEVI